MTKIHVLRSRLAGGCQGGVDLHINISRSVFLRRTCGLNIRSFVRNFRSVCSVRNFTMIPTSTVSRLVEIGLRITGITEWPGWPNSSILFRLVWSAVMGTGLIFQYHYLLMHFSTKELPNLIDGLSTTLPYSLLFFKLIVLWINNRYAFSFL